MSLLALGRRTQCLCTLATWPPLHPALHRAGSLQSRCGGPVASSAVFVLCSLGFLVPCAQGFFSCSSCAALLKLGQAEGGSRCTFIGGHLGIQCLFYRTMTRMQMPAVAPTCPAHPLLCLCNVHAGCCCHARRQAAQPEPDEECDVGGHGEPRDAAVGSQLQVCGAAREQLLSHAAVAAILIMLWM